MNDELFRYPIIGKLNDEDLHSIRPYLTVHSFDNGTVILRQNQETAHFHILLDGILNVYVEQETKVHVAKLEKGQFVGEMSCLTGGAVSATVQAQGQVRTVSMPREGMLQLMDRSPEFRNHMIEAMIQRVTNTNHRVLEEYTRSSVVLRQLQEERQSHYGPLVGDGRFMRQLRKKITELSQKNEPLCIIGDRGVGKSHAAWEIHAQSGRSEHPFFVVEGKSFGTEEWEMKVRAAKGGTIVLEQADSLPSDLVRRLVHAPDETRFILTAGRRLHADVEHLEIPPLRERQEDLPALVYSFIAEAGFQNPESLISQEAMNRLSDFPFLGGNIQELKRVVHDAMVRSSGKEIRNSHLRFGSVREPGARPKIGLALGSGSVRGAAHVGVIKVLEQAGIPIDLIAGTSVGAFIGALYAGGQPVSAFEKVLPTVRWGQLVLPTLPLNGIVDNSPMVRFVEKYIGPVDFKDLSIPFAAVASDAVNGEACILNQGKVSRAICASTAIPGVMRPVKYGDKLLLDGAVAHPVPVALAKSMGADIVIAVDVSTPDDMKKEPKNFVATILNTMDIMSKRMIQDELQLADVVLSPRLKNNQITFKASASYIQAGEYVTRESLEAIKQKMETFVCC
ncbi:patatin-like phospholipase family protein [Paenibacillus oceani]|uniref:Patatin-like phospholipase family protein n=1 Tax=Paenibacillus oceani TaxID=2772510 RepID=A0A927H4F5_9BACL|nr:patatin-like phospholipase family protein [Paenibacillus oceani]MBD2866464.1 patatin-like phospholipase family protein [Paenibacillus oceani]